MAEIFRFSFEAVMPILLLVFVGVVLRRVGFGDEHFYKKLNSLVFKLFLPVLLYFNIYEIKSIAQVNFKAVLFCLPAILIICLLGYIITKLFFKDRASFGVLTQCSFRSNYAIIGLPLAESLGGSSAVAFASVVSAAAIPAYNILAVIILSHYSPKNHRRSIRHTFLQTIRNPLIIGVFLGIITLLLREILSLNGGGVPLFTIKDELPYLYNAISRLAKVASPLALVVLGARFDYKAADSMKKEIFTGTLMRLVLAPVIGLGLAAFLDYSGVLFIGATEYPALIALFSTPVAVSSAVMTAEIGGNEQLANQLVVWTSIFSMFTMFIIIFIIKSAALL